MSDKVKKKSSKLRKLRNTLVLAFALAVGVGIGEYKQSDINTSLPDDVRAINTDTIHKRDSHKVVFNKLSRKFAKNYSKKMERLVVTDNDEIIYVAPAIDDDINNDKFKFIKDFFGIDALSKLVDHNHDYFNEDNMAGGVHFGDVSYLSNVLGNTIAVNEVRYKDKNGNLPKERLVSTYLHEVGHALVKNGRYGSSFESKHVAECAATAFETLMLPKVYNTFFKLDNPDVIKLGDDAKIYYADAVISKISSLEKKMGKSLRELPDEVMVDLAGELADKYSFSGEKLKKLFDVYRPISKMIKDNGGKVNMECLIKTAEIILDNKDDHDVYRSGVHFLSSSNAAKCLKSFYKETGLVAKQKRVLDEDAFGGIIAKKNYIKNYIYDSVTEKSRTWRKLLDEIELFEEISGIEVNTDKARDAELGDEAITVETVKKMLEEHHAKHADKTASNSQSPEV